eukprot:1446964-Prymnesium_polylepis.1
MAVSQCSRSAAEVAITFSSDDSRMRRKPRPAAPLAPVSRSCERVGGEGWAVRVRRRGVRAWAGG